MGSFDEIVKQNQKILQLLRQLIRVTNSGFDVKISEELSGFQNTWSGLNQVEDAVISGFNILSGQLARKINIEISGFGETWDRLDIISGQLARKINIEISGFEDTWSGLNNIETDVETLQVIENSGLDTIHDDLVTISGQLERKIDIEISGFQNVWSGLRLLKGGETIVLSNGESINGANRVSGQLGCYDRWTLYLAASGNIDVTVELTPDTAPPYFWFEIDESAISVSSGGYSTSEMGYDATWIRLTGSNPSGVIARVRGCW